MLLTKRQKQILGFITKYISKNDYAPTLEEIKDHFGLSSVATIHEHIQTLKNKRCLNKIENQPRAIDINKTEKMLQIPLLGTIAAGEPIEAIQEKETIAVPQNKIPRSGEIYALKVIGNSMIDENINAGDIILVKHQSTAENGQKVVALIDNNNATLKKFYKEKNHIRLQPANKNIGSIIIKNGIDIEIQGIVVDIIKDSNFINPELKQKLPLTSKTKLKRNIKKLDVSFEKNCACPPNHINCLNGKQWLKNQVAVWEFSYTKEDVRDKNIHPAVFPVGLPAKCIELFTHKEELVLDPFVGIGTTLIAARNLERNAIGFDLGKKYIDFCKKRLAQNQLLSTAKQISICDDAFNISDYLNENTISLSVTSPPYANMLNRKRKNKSLRGDLRKNQHYKKIQQYSNDPRDLGTMEPKKFAGVLGEIYRKILPLHKPGAHCVINITDLWWENKRIPIHLYVIETMEKVGYELRNTLIWDRRNLVNRAGIFGWPSNYITLGTTFEYILDFWRPKENK